MPLPPDKPDTLRYIKLRFRHRHFNPVRRGTSIHSEDSELLHSGYSNLPRAAKESSPCQELQGKPPQTGMSHHRERAFGQSSETSQVNLSDPHRPHLKAEIQAQGALCQPTQDPAAFERYPVKAPRDTPQDWLHHLCLESMKVPSHRSRPVDSEHVHDHQRNGEQQQIPLVVNRLAPEFGIPSNECAVPGLGQPLHLEDGKDSKLNVPIGKTGANNGGLPERTPDQDLSYIQPWHSNLVQHNIHGGVHIAPVHRASTMSDSVGLDTAETAAPLDRRQVTRSPTLRSKAGITHLEAALANPLVLSSGFRKRTGSPTSNPRWSSLRLLPKSICATPHECRLAVARMTPLALSPRGLLPLLEARQSHLPTDLLTVTLENQEMPSREDSLIIPNRYKTNTKCNTTERHCQRREMSQGGPNPAIQSTVEPDLPSPCSDCDSEHTNDDEQYDTPMTSPSSSPPKSRADFWRRERLRNRLVQLDGGGGSGNEDSNGLHEEQPSKQTITQDDVNISEHHVKVVSSTETDDEDKKNFVALQNDCGSDDLTTPASDEDSLTPLVPASPAKGATAFPFPSQSNVATVKANLVRRRHPSTLLKHCERNATPRQRRLMGASVDVPDRFIPSRSATPSKEALLLPKASQTFTPSGKCIVSQELMDDPFGPMPRRSLRMVEQYATTRHPLPSPRPVGMLGSRVRESASPVRRSASMGTVWTVGGTVVTEGVASTSNGRGGRVTSGSNAPHYTAEFLLNNSPSDEEITHGRRLAMAMDIEPRTRMMEQSPTPASKSSRNRRVWQDGGWEVDGVTTPTKVKTKKEKGVPVIPFRVLDAPALRDDYYCSLLAYSQTVECLAVGLGPHVYLWSETRGKTNIPDSLTAPLGASHVTSVSFSSQEGGSAILAIGRADGRITLWSPLDPDPRFDSEQPAPVSCVCFRPNPTRRPSLRDSIALVATEELLVGDEVGSVYYYSVEWPNQDQRDLFDWHGSMTLLARITCHSQQICGIAWSPDGEFFASGGNDNQLFLFESKRLLQPTVRVNKRSISPVRVRNGSPGSTNAPFAGQGGVLQIAPGHEKQIFTLNAAVKAIAFAPWQPTLLAAGSGSNDRCIHFFHTLSGASLATIDCHAQVTSLVWSAKRKEIAATFGFAQPEHPYRVAVFTWPGCSMVVGIPWYGEERALFAVPYPRGPSNGQPHRRRQGDIIVSDTGRRADTEGQPWYGKRTREEGCLVVATSDASIKFHEIWAERREGGKKSVVSGSLGGSQILEGECSPEIERVGAIR